MSARILVAVTLFPALALAHPGHGTTGASTWMHYLTEPVHASSLALALIAIIAFWSLSRARSERSRN